MFIMTKHPDITSIDQIEYRVAFMNPRYKRGNIIGLDIVYSLIDEVLKRLVDYRRQRIDVVLIAELEKPDTVIGAFCCYVHR